MYRYHSTGYAIRKAQMSRLATLSSIQARRPFQKTAKATKDVQAKAKRLMREMLVFWKKNEKEERDVRKREQKEAIDRAKIEEEKREAARQARKLEFLISQTELYSHFVGNKLKSAYPFRSVYESRGVVLMAWNSCRNRGRRGCGRAEGRGPSGRRARKVAGNRL